MNWVNNLYVISGPNGADKTTASMTILPEVLNCYEFVNADEIARGLSPLNPNSANIQAGKIMLKRIDHLMKKGVDFAFETTLASKSFVNRIEKAKTLNYDSNLIFFYLESEELAIKRVEIRVQEGGHNMPTEVIIRKI